MQITSESLYKKIIKENAKSTSICWLSIILSSLSRGVKVFIFSLDDIKSICNNNSINYKPHYHQVGKVFGLEYDGSFYILNKSKFLKSKLPSGFSKKALKNSKDACYKSPKGACFLKKDFDKAFYDSLGLSFPVVLKPLGGSMGKGVFLDIYSYEDLAKIVSGGDKDGLVVEEQIEGDEYRVYLIRGKYFGAVRRIPPQVIGDGQHTVRELIGLKNKKKRRRGLPQIKLKKADDFLSKRGVSLSFIPPVDEIVILGSVLGRSSGGDVFNAGDDFPNSILEKINLLGEGFVENLCIGLDIIVSGGDLYIVEVNDPVFVNLVGT